MKDKPKIRKTKALAECETLMRRAVYPEGKHPTYEHAYNALEKLVAHYFGREAEKSFDWDEIEQEFYFYVEYLWHVPAPGAGADAHDRGYPTTTRILCVVKPGIADLETQLDAALDKVHAMREACNNAARLVYARNVADDIKREEQGVRS